MKSFGGLRRCNAAVLDETQLDLGNSNATSALIDVPHNPRGPRVDNSVSDKGIYVFGTFRLDPVRRTLMRDGAPVKLAGRLFDTLLYLLQNPETLVTRSELENAVWPGRALEASNLQKAVSSLRKALMAGGAADSLVVTIPGRGFRFALPVTVEPATLDAVGAGPFASIEFPGSRVAAQPARSRSAWAAAGLGALTLAAACGAMWHFVGRPAIFAPPPNSVPLWLSRTWRGSQSRTVLLTVFPRSSSIC